MGYDEQPTRIDSTASIKIHTPANDGVYEIYRDAFDRAPACFIINCSHFQDSAIGTIAAIQNQAIEASEIQIRRRRKQVSRSRSEIYF